MFKKQPIYSTTNRISNKDRNAIKQLMVSSMHAESVTKFFSDNKTLSCRKLTGSKVLIYTLQSGTPALVAEDNKNYQNPYFPTVYTLSTYPQMLPCVVLKPGVEQFVLNGANLMWPGVWRIEGGLWVEGQVVALAMSEGVIVAVARMKETVKQEEFATKTGVACILLHTICDKLVAVPEVFLTKPIIMVKKELSKQEVQKPIAKIQQPAINQLKQQQVILSDNVEIAKEVDKQEQFSDEQQVQQESEEDQQEKPLTPQQMSELFRQAFLTSIFFLRPTKKDKPPGIQLPIDSGQFFSEYMKKSVPQDTTLDISKSTFKKLSNFYDQLEKEGIIKCKDKKFKGSTVKTINEIDFEHKILEGFKPEVRKFKKEEKTTGEKPFPLTFREDLEVIKLGKARKQLFWIFANIKEGCQNKQILKDSDFIVDEKAMDQIYPMRQLQRLIQSFITKVMARRAGGFKNGLLDIDLTKNPFLNPLFSKQLAEIKKSVQEEEKMQILPEVYQAKNKHTAKDMHTVHVNRGAFERAALRFIDDYFQTATSNESTQGLKPSQPTKGRSQPIQLLTTRHHNKIITWIVGLDRYLACNNIEQELTQFCKYLSNRFACGSNYSQLRGSQEIMVQGNCILKLAKMLQNEYHIPRDSLSYVIPKKQPGRKKKK